MSLEALISKANWWIDKVIGLGFTRPPSPSAVHALAPRRPMPYGIRPQDEAYWAQSDRQRDSMLHFAQIASSRSTCVRSKVGAVVVNHYGAIIGTGHNYIVGGGSEPCTYHCPRAMLTTAECPSGSPYDAPGQECHAVHAEVAAIRSAQYRWLATDSREILRGMWVFSSRKPCADCEAFLDALGVRFMWLAE